MLILLDQASGLEWTYLGLLDMAHVPSC
jgi:hypothetical protein